MLDVFLSLLINFKTMFVVWVSLQSVKWKDEPKGCGRKLSWPKWRELSPHLLWGNTIKKKVAVRQVCGPEIGYEPRTYQIWNISVSYSTTTSGVFFVQRTVTLHWTHQDSARFQLLRHYMEMWAIVHANIIGGMQVLACRSVSSCDDSVLPHVKKINLHQNRSKGRICAWG